MSQGRGRTARLHGSGDLPRPLDRRLTGAASLGTSPPTDRLAILDATDPAWDDWIESTTHDVYHTAAYHRVATFEGDGTPQLIVYGSRDRFVAWPYLLNAIPDTGRSIGGPAFDVSSTYGYSGPLAHGCDPGDPLIAEAWDAFRSVWRRQHVVSVFTRFHPILENHRWFVDAMQPGEGGGTPEGVVLTGQTVSIDLQRPDEQIISEYPRTFRQEIASSRRKGLVTEVDRDWVHLDAFLDLYDETMRRNRAQDVYFLRRQYFTDLIGELGDDTVLFVARYEGQIAAACLFLSHHGILHPHLAGTSTPFLSMSPLKVMWDDVRRWAAERGDRVMHLGGGRGGADDSLFAFKSRFSPVHSPFYTGRWILDEPRYERLARRSLGEVDSETGYFPIYRAPRTLE